jgi:Leucine-rich repeat (LRR) protein
MKQMTFAGFKKLSKQEKEEVVTLSAYFDELPDKDALKYMKAISELPNLQRLSINRCSLKVWTEALGELNLIQLYIRDSKVELLPHKFLKSEKLTDLSFEHCPNLDFRSIPDGSFPSVRALELLRCVSPEEVMEFPSFICGMTNLEILKVNSCSLMELPEGLVNLTKLKILEAANNILRDFPPVLVKMPWLMILDLSHNILTDCNGVENVRALTTLRLANNCLRSVTPSIGELKDMQVLDLHENFIESIPDEVGKLHNLQNLNVTYNSRLASLPESVKETNLFLLEIKGSKIDYSQLRGFLPHTTIVR